MPSETKTSSPYVAIKKAAKILNVSISTVRRMFDKGDIEGVITPGGHRRILRSEVDRVLEEMVASQESGKFIILEE